MFSLIGCFGCFYMDKGAVVVFCGWYCTYLLMAGIAIVSGCQAVSAIDFGGVVCIPVVAVIVVASRY